MDEVPPESADTIVTRLLFTDRKETEKWLQLHHIPALGIGMINNGQIQEARVFGVLEAGRAAPDDAIFNVASLTKPVTALVTLTLVDAGLFDLDESLAKYWIDPDVANDSRLATLTARHVLSHRSGFPNWRRSHADHRLSFEFAPGTQYQYSGEGYEYLRRALEKKFNTTLDRIARMLIFKPLGMNDTRFFWDATMDSSRFAKWHDAAGHVYETDKTTTASAADDLLTTVGDYCRFMVHVMNGGGLSKGLADQMMTGQVRIKPGKSFGLGWWIDENVCDGENALVHGGDDKGVHTIAFILPKSRQGLLLFTNCDNGTEIYEQAVSLMLGACGRGIIERETK